ncbi:hypothetical protein E6C60_3817 [Paenibacillus algicola]|uniref:Uncharacterized protein n=1 Tax=Paenibacillus algicola TaxID=2565926 RepID=A0A4P8XNS7_9BACL|nr:hypothetical protein E6C60_3817 [Paenibacillus algicola]
MLRPPCCSTFIIFPYIISDLLYTDSLVTTVKGVYRLTSSLPPIREVMN